ncbi:MAG: hypothetical protein JW829_14820 [Pirellulales bacterium]|nr:hypothetical protein [Pirellulales bacterium]
MRYFRLSGITLLSLILHTQLEAARFEGLGHLPGGGSYSIARSVSSDGSTVVGTSDSANGFCEAFRWNESKAMAGLGDIDGGVFFSDAYAVSSDGSVVVGEGVSALGVEAFLWTQASGMRGLGDLPGIEFSSRATGVTADGLTVIGTGNYSSGSGPHPVTGEAFRWNELEGMVRMGFLPGGSQLSAATGVSSNGSVIVGYSQTASGSIEAFRWTSTDGMIGLGSLPGSTGNSQTIANAISADGSLIVGTNISTMGEEAFIWDEAHGMRRLQEVLTKEFALDLSGWNLTSATGISADGTVIVGAAYGPHFQQEAWRVVLLPDLVADFNEDSAVDS